MFNSCEDESAPRLAISAHGLAAGYNGEMVLEDMTFRLPMGQWVALAGPNGAGKSTLLKLIVGMKRPSAGELLLFGTPVQLGRKGVCLAYVPQHEQIDWDYPISVEEVVLTGRYGLPHGMGLRQRLWPRSFWWKHQEVVNKALEAVDLMGHGKQPIAELSGGQRKRAFTARALARQANLILLDEPLVGVDKESELRILDVLHQERMAGKTIVMVTHELGVVEPYVDRVLLVNKTIMCDRVGRRRGFA